ncbi:MAG TPA: YIP1 family protein [Bacteroidota bacterium]|nr:YIP1 family protein [Bacteroidota bacterium]
MEQNTQSQSGPVEITSFGMRAVNALTSPGELYAEVSAAPVQLSSWLIPYLIMIALVGLMMFSITNNPALFDQITRQQAEQMRTKIAEGSMTQEDADRAKGFIENKALFLAFGIVGGVLFMSVIMFGAPLVLWAASKGVLKFGGGYRKILEIYGLATVIGIVGTLVSAIMMNMMDSMYAQPGGALLVKDVYDEANFGHNFLAAMNVFAIWQTAVTGIGLSAVSGKKTVQGMALAFGLWLVYVVVASFLGWGAR